MQKVDHRACLMYVIQSRMIEVNNINYNGFLRGLEELLHMGSNSLNGGEVLRELPDWDSLAIVEFMAFADQRYSITMAPKQITSCSTVHDLFSAVTATAHEVRD
jgi:acyl carrier protein